MWRDTAEAKDHRKAMTITLPTRLNVHEDEGKGALAGRLLRLGAVERHAGDVDAAAGQQRREHLMGRFDD